MSASPNTWSERVKWKAITCIRHGVDDLQSVSHAIGKQSGIFFAAKVEPPNLSGISPLVKIGRGLVVFESSYNGAVYNHLKMTDNEWLDQSEQIWIEHLYQRKRDC